MNVRRAYAIVRSRMPGDREQAQGLLDSLPPAKRQEMNRQQGQAATHRAKAYKLGEKLRRRK